MFLFPINLWKFRTYLEEEKLYKKFKLDESWDSPHNIKLLDQMPKFYESNTQVLPKGQTMALAPVTEASAISQNPEDGNLGTTFAVSKQSDIDELVGGCVINDGKSFEP